MSQDELQISRPDETNTKERDLSRVEQALKFRVAGGARSGSCEIVFW